MSDSTPSPAILESEALSPNAIFGPSPVLPGDDAAAYIELLNQFSHAVKPNDIVEKILVHDVVDYTWQIWRWRKLKNRLTLDEIPNQLEKALAPLVNEHWLAPAYSNFEIVLAQTEEIKQTTAAYKLAQQWAIKNPDAIKRIESLLETQSLSMEVITARAIANILDQIDRIDRAILTAENWRNSILREIDRHKEAFAQKLSGAVDQIEDAEFETIETESKGLIAGK